MHVGVIVVHIFIPDASSLKAKRMVLRRIKDRIRFNFNVSIAEVDSQDKWQRAALAASCVSNEKKHADSMLNKVRDFFERDKNITVTDYKMEII